VRSIYFRDPNGYVIELTAKTARHAQEMDPATNAAREKLDRWQAQKRPATAAGKRGPAIAAPGWPPMTGDAASHPPSLWTVTAAPDRDWPRSKAPCMPMSRSSAEAIRVARRHSRLPSAARRRHCSRPA